MVLSSIPVATVTSISSTVPSPASVAVLSPGQVAVTSSQNVAVWTLNGASSGSFSPSGPYFLGIGFVPKTAISASGYATTNPSYFFHVGVDSPGA